MSIIPELIAIEFPGYAKDPETLLKLIGGSEALLSCISKNSSVALYMRPDLFSRPVYGHIIPTSNLAIKIIKQKNSKTGEIRTKHEIIGIINHTVRFRSLADYQVLPDPNNPIVKLRKDLQEWNIDNIEKFRFSHEKGIVEDLSNIPPPLFSPIETALDYKYAQNPAVIKVKVDEDGLTKIKTINKNSNTDRLHCATLNFKDQEAPSGPPEAFKPLDVPEAAIREITNLFQNHRAVWSRTALLNSMTPEYTKHIKQLLPRVAYLVPRGGFKDTWVRYGYDPRKDSSSAKWQIISMRSTLKKEKIFRGFISLRAPQSPSKLHTSSHIFDGRTFNGSINTFQICDIIDPDIQSFIIKHGTPRNRFRTSTGWYSSKFIDHLRKIITNKTSELRGEPSSCVLPEDFVEDSESSDSSSLSSSSDEEELLAEPEDLEDSVKSKVTELMRLLRGDQGIHDADDMEEYSFFQED